MAGAPSSPLPVFGKMCHRPRVEGKFLFAGADKLYVRGMSFGAVLPQAGSGDHEQLQAVERDFELMARYGFNVATVAFAPPAWWLDLAAKYGLRVLIALGRGACEGWWRRRSRLQLLRNQVRREVRACSGHPALLGYAFAVEIPADLLRDGRAARAERLIERLWRAAQAEDPHALYTFAATLATADLQLDFLDFATLCVEGQAADQQQILMSRMQRIARERPLLVAGLGWAGPAHGEQEQACEVEAQLRGAFAAGCAGAVLGCWSGRPAPPGQHRGPGLEFVSPAGRAHPALDVARQVFAELPFPPQHAWPSISIVVQCERPGTSLGSALHVLQMLEYSRLEIVVAGSRYDGAAASVAEWYGVPFVGVEGSRPGAVLNEAVSATSGQVVAFLDSAAHPDADWLKFLGAAFANGEYAAVAGSTTLLRAAGFMAICLADAPVGLLTRLLPGSRQGYKPATNMAVRRTSLAAVGGFDPQFQRAGAFIDLCWRLRRKGYEVGFLPAALVWEQPCDSLRDYWRRQRDNGVDEYLLRRKWPSTFVGLRRRAPSRPRRKPSHARAWEAQARPVPDGALPRVSPSHLYAGPTMAASLARAPQLYLLAVLLASLSAFGLLWGHLAIALPVLFSVAAAAVIATGLRIIAAPIPGRRSAPGRRLSSCLVGVGLRLLRPPAELSGRLSSMFYWHPTPEPISHPAPIRAGPSILLPAIFSFDSPAPRGPHEWLEILLSVAGAGEMKAVRRAQPDLSHYRLPGMRLGSAQLQILPEAGTSGRQRLRLIMWPRIHPGVILLLLLYLALAVLTTSSAGWAVSLLLVLGAFLLTALTLYECGTTLATLRRGARTLAEWLALQQRALERPDRPGADTLAAAGPAGAAGGEAGSATALAAAPPAAGWAPATRLVPRHLLPDAVHDVPVPAAAPATPLVMPPELRQGSLELPGPAEARSLSGQQAAGADYDAGASNTRPELAAAGGDEQAMPGHMCVAAVAAEPQSAAMLDGEVDAGVVRVSATERGRAPSLAAMVPELWHRPAEGEPDALAGYQPGLRELEVRGSGDVPAQLAIVAAYIQQGRWEDALAIYRTLLKRPDLSPFLIDVVLEDLDALQGEAPDSRLLRLVRAEAYLGQGRYHEALEEYGRIDWDQAQPTARSMAQAGRRAAAEVSPGAMAEARANE